MKKKTSKKVGKIATKETATKAVKKTGDFLADNKKELLYVSAAIVLSVVGYRLYKSAVKSISEAFDDKVDVVGVDVKINTSKTTISIEQAKQFAQVLLDAFNHKQPLWGTDEAAILGVFNKLKTADDFKLVYKSFGYRQYNGYNSPPQGYFRHLDDYYPRDLIYWLKEEIGPSDGKVYQVVKSRIESAGMAF